MIKLEHNTLVLDSSHTKEDQKAVNDFVEYRVKETKEQLLKALEELENQSHQTRTPIYQDTFFTVMRKKISSL